MKQDGATVVLFKDEDKKEVFLVFRSDYPIWVTTGGALEEGETPGEAALREAKEETGLDVTITRFVGTYLIEECGETRKSYLFDGRVVGGSFRPEFSGCKGQWFPVDGLPFSMPKRNKVKVRDCLLEDAVPFCKEERPISFRTDFLLIFRHPLAAFKYIFNRI